MTDQHIDTNNMKLSNLSRIFTPMDYKGTDSRIKQEGSDTHMSNDKLIYSFTGKSTSTKFSKRSSSISNNDNSLKKLKQEGNQTGLFSKLKKSTSFKKFSKPFLPNDLKTPKHEYCYSHYTPVTPDSLQISIFSDFPDLPKISHLPSLPESNTMIDQVMTDFIMDESIQPQNSISETSLFHTSLYLQQMHSENSKITILDENSDDSVLINNYDIKEDQSKFTFEITNDDDFTTSTPQLILRKSNVPIGLALEKRGSFLKSNNPFLDGLQLSPLHHKNKNFEFYEPLNKSEIIKSNRLPLRDFNQSCNTKMSPPTPLKFHKKVTNNNPFSDFNQIDPNNWRFSKSQILQNKIQLRAQMDSQSHLDLVNSMVDHEGNQSIHEDENIENNSIYEGLSAAEVNDYQKIAMWANY